MPAKPALLPGGALGEIGFVVLDEKDNGARATRDRKLHNFSLRALRGWHAPHGLLRAEITGLW